MAIHIYPPCYPLLWFALRGHRGVPSPARAFVQETWQQPWDSQGAWPWFHQNDTRPARSAGVELSFNQFQAMIWVELISFNQFQSILVDLMLRDLLESNIWVLHPPPESRYDVARSSNWVARWVQRSGAWSSWLLGSTRCNVVLEIFLSLHISLGHLGSSCKIWNILKPQLDIHLALTVVAEPRFRRSPPRAKLGLVLQVVFGSSGVSQGLRIDLSLQVVDMFRLCIVRLRLVPCTKFQLKFLESSA